MDSPFNNRHDVYESSYDYHITPRLPIVIRVNGRHFSNLTKRLDRPFCSKLINVFKSTLLQTIQQLDGAVFGFQYSDEFTFVLRNDRNFEEKPFCKNNIQELNGLVSSLVSVNFFKNLVLEDELNELDGDAIFKTKVFALPSLNEAVNHIILKQQFCYGDAIFRATQAEFVKIYGKSEADRLLYGKKLDDKIDLLYSECKIDYENYYPKSFRLGVAAYKVNKIIRKNDVDEQKKKWIIDSNLPSFIEDRNFLSNIIVSGTDVFRADRDLIIQD
jgi:tRNA(His) 5'-end guanylyltransferase